MENNSKPFSLNYVLKATKTHMRKCVDISIRKTVERIAEFDSNNEMSKEVFNTLATLYALKRSLDEDIAAYEAASHV